MGQTTHAVNKKRKMREQKIFWTTNPLRSPEKSVEIEAVSEINVTAENHFFVKYFINL